MIKHIFSSSFPEFLKITIVLIFIILLIFSIFKLLVYLQWAKIYNKKTPFIKIQNSISLGNREKVIILQIEKDCIVLGVTPNCINYLYTISNKNNHKFNNKSKSSFKDYNAKKK